MLSLVIYKNKWKSLFEIKHFYLKLVHTFLNGLIDAFLYFQLYAELFSYAAVQSHENIYIYKSRYSNQEILLII